MANDIMTFRQDISSYVIDFNEASLMVLWVNKALLI